MEPIIYKGTDDTPTIILDKQNNNFEFSGKSIPENPSKFYAPIMDWLKQYAASPNKKTEIHFKMVYFNTASSKLILDMFEKLEKIAEDGYEIVIKWYHDSDDEDMEEAGEEYSEMIEVPFEIISY